MDNRNGEMYMATLKLFQDNQVYILERPKEQIDFLIHAMERVCKAYYNITKNPDNSFTLSGNQYLSSEQLLYRILLLSETYENSIVRSKKESPQ